MFLLFGISNGRKDLNESQLMICQKCGKYGRYRIYMTYTCLSLFFIPVFKWNRHYFVQAECCGSIYRLDKEKGRAILKGAEPWIRPQDLGPEEGVWEGRIAYRRCPVCGYETTEDFEYCPRCGRRFL